MTVRRQVGTLGAALLFSAVMAAVSSAQEQATAPTPSEAATEKHDSSSKGNETEAHSIATTSEGTQPGLLKRFLDDQQRVWTSPTKLRLPDTEWLVPLSGFTAGLVVTDSDFNKGISHNPKTMNRYNNISNASLAALVGGAGGMWLLSHETHNEHWRETGFLSGEAALNSLVVVEGMKYSFGRQRPDEGNGNGQFFQGGTSFPSEHAAAAWSVAGVVAHEYPGWFPKMMAYGLATLVDISRIKAQKHFPSDVLVGTVIGNLVAQNIYSRHHDFNLGGGEWRSISQIFRGDGTRSPASQGSPYVPLDSWIYPAMDRLAAMGLIDSGFAGMRPWTRNECVRLLGEAGDRVESGVGGTEAEKIYNLLEAEFGGDRERIDSGGLLRAGIESIYGRMTEISGQPLTDGNYFGQTITNDFGRPYQEGFNFVGGVSAWTTSGRWATYARAEYQHSPSAPALPLSARQFIGSVDHLPGVPPATPFSSVDQVQLLDAYAGLTFDNWQVSFGKQSLWWSPMQSGPLMFSDNAEPINMFRISRVSPFRLPSFLGWLGPMRLELFVGQLTGHGFVDDDTAGFVGQLGVPLARQPMLHGEKLSFKPTPNFEFSVNETTVFVGGPTPLTGHNFLKSYSGFAVKNSGDITDPRSGVDFSYRVPGLRKWLTFYGDAFTEDEYSPLGYPRKSAIQGGIYMPRIPGIPKLDLRLEGGTTAPVDFPECHGCFYANDRYPGGSYLSNGNLLGSWLGRGGQGERVWSTYWLSSRNKIQLQFRHQKVDGDYLPHGGTLNDGGINVEFQVRPEVTVSGLVQYEKWNYPILSPSVQSNVTTSIQLTFWPHLWK
jgi:Capsule assembly protein Wzi/PAP2 superfamily